MSKKKVFIVGAITFFILSFVTIFSKLNNSGGEKVREPVVAGAFYPANPGELARMVDELIGKANPKEINGQVVGLVCPHAGYIYSGHVAAHSYALLKGKDIERVVIISPSHVTAFSGAAIYDGDVYATPLGRIEVDKKFAEKLASSHRLLKLSEEGHETLYQGRGEHAIEVQLPFLQRVLGEFKLVPVVMGDQNYETCRTLGKALAKLIKDNKTIIVASSDLSHFHSYDEAVKLDHKVINAIKEWDYFNLLRNLQSRIWEACGGGPIVATMIAAEELGANEAILLKYANSGDVPAGERSRVVGYSAIAFCKNKEAHRNKDNEFSLSKAEQEELLKIARQAVESIVRQKKVLEISHCEYEALKQDRGAFVTLRKHGQLRGCIGYTAPIQPLYLTVRDAAISAAERDPRFRPVQEDELDELSYEISVLSPMRHVRDINEIVIGKHGLVVKKGYSEGLLLPQVAPEQGWDCIEFLEHTCRKAGLPPEAWKDEDTDIFCFTAFVFGEH